METIAENHLPEFCLEYMVTGLHAQMSFADCILCSTEKKQLFLGAFEAEEEKKEDNKQFRKNGKNDENLPDENIYEDKYYELEQAAEDEADLNEGISTTEQNAQETIIEEAIVNLTSLVEKQFKNSQCLSILLDLSMGTIPLIWKVDENRLSYAIRILSQSLQTLQSSQLFNIVATSGKHFRQWYIPADNIAIQDSDDYLIGLENQVDRRAIIESIKKQVESATQPVDIFVFTDFTDESYADHEAKLLQALEGQKKQVKIHIFSLFFGGKEEIEQKQGAISFWKNIAKASKGSFTGSIGVQEKITTEQY